MADGFSQPPDMLSHERVANKSRRARIAQGMRPRSSASNPNQAEMLLQIDSNKDGVISSEEFSEFLRSKPQPKKLQFSQLLGRARRDKNRVEVVRAYHRSFSSLLICSVTDWRDHAPAAPTDDDLRH